MLIASALKNNRGQNLAGLKLHKTAYSTSPVPTNKSVVNRKIWTRLLFFIPVFIIIWLPQSIPITLDQQKLTAATKQQ